jgi:Ca2+-binding RTX toxin-like protein
VFTISVADINPENVTGSDLPDIIYGGGAGDTLAGAGGDDLIVGGAGDDLLLGGARGVLTQRAPQCTTPMVTLHS